MGTPATSGRAPAWTSSMRRLWGLAGRLAGASGISREDLVYDRCREHYGVERLHDLTVGQVDELIAWLAGQAPPAERPARRRPRREGPDPRVAGDEYLADASPRPRAHEVVTPGQAAALQSLRRALGWSMERYQAFSERQVGIPWPQTRRQAAAVHEGLEAMLARQWPPARIRRTLARLRQVDDLTPWERGFVLDLVKRMGSCPTLNFSRIIKLQEIDRKRGGDDG